MAFAWLSAAASAVSERVGFVMGAWGQDGDADHIPAPAEAMAYAAAPGDAAAARAAATAAGKRKAETTPRFDDRRVDHRAGSNSPDTRSIDPLKVGSDVRGDLPNKRRRTDGSVGAGGSAGAAAGEGPPPPSTQSPAPSTRSHVPSTQSPVPSTQSHVPSTQSERDAVFAQQLTNQDKRERQQQVDDDAALARSFGLNNSGGGGDGGGGAVLSGSAALAYANDDLDLALALSAAEADASSTTRLSRKRKALEDIVGELRSYSTQYTSNTRSSSCSSNDGRKVVRQAWAAAPMLVLHTTSAEYQQQWYAEQYHLRSIGSTKIALWDLWTMAPSQQLNDKVINAYLSMLGEWDLASLTALSHRETHIFRGH